MKQKLTTIFCAPLSRFALAWREGHRQTAKDFRTRWRRCGLWLLIVAWLAISLVIFAGLLSMNEGFIGGDMTACLPDGSFRIDPSDFRYFSRSGFFQVTLAFGNLSFTQAKVIDVAWDILVGRGGQALIAYISWQTFANYVTTSMEVAPITFRTYRTIFLPGGSLIFDILRMVRDFSFRHGLHSKIAMCFMIFTMAFTLAFPTFASAMTGYSGNVEAFVNATDSNYVPFESFQYAYFVIHDGWRIEKEWEYIVTEPSEATYSGPFQPTVAGATWRNTFCTSYSASQSRKQCEWPFAVAAYVRVYGFDGKAENASTFMGRPLEPPVLNISAFHLPRVLAAEATHTESMNKENFKDRMRWAYGNNTYKWGQLQQRGKCQAVLWGFSFIQLFLMVVTLFIWTIGVLVMWLTSQITMKRRGRKDVAGENKAILELSNAMQKQLSEYTKEEGEDNSSITESVLSDRIKKDLGGGSISYSAPLLPNGESTEKWSFLNWLKTHRWSIAMMCMFAAITAVCAVWIPFTGFYLVTLPLDFSIALYMGSTRKSRGIFFFWASVIFGLVPNIVLVLLFTKAKSRAV